MPSNLEYKILHRIADNLAPVADANLRSGIKLFRKRIDLRQIERLVASGRANEIAGMLPWAELPKDLRTFEKNIARGIELGGENSIEFYKKAVGKLIPDIRNAKIAFDLNNPRVQKYLADRVGGLITAFGSSSQAAIHEIITTGFAKGVPIRDMAEQIRNVGLHPRQVRAVGNFYDRSLKKWMDEGLTLGKAQTRARAAADVYAERQLKYRTNMIARTEMMRAVNGSQQEVWNQASDAGIMPDNAMKVWLVTPDDALCSICEPMEGIETEINGTWSTENGEVTVPNEIHPSCFDRTTQVLSKRGWLFFNEVKDDDLMLSVDPVSLKSEWVGIVKKVRYLHKGQMHSIQTHNIDLITTPAHAHVYYDRILKLDRGEKLFNDKLFINLVTAPSDVTEAQDRARVFINPIRKARVKTIDNYVGEVFDVELEKFHTLFVRRNDRVMISGNCRCSFGLVFK